MGIVNNTTYRDMYHFKKRPFTADLEELPSLNVDGEINTTIKNNTERSNVEIEKGEIVLQDDLSALFKALGKTHKQGGVDVYLKPNSFVFSNDKGLAISKKEKELFEFKEGGKWKKDKNTPAEVLKKNIDMEHYNRLVQNLDDKNKDDLAKKSSALMLEKYIGTLGNIAFLQEKKKSFPDGLPFFSQGTAPVFAPGLKEEVEAQKQYAKFGGYIKNPQMPDGGYPPWLKAWRTPKTPSGKITSTGQLSTYEHDDNQLKEDYKYWKGVAGRDFKDASDFQGFIYDYNLQKDPNAVAGMWSRWGQTNGNGDKPPINYDAMFKGQPMTRTGQMPNVDFLGRKDVRANFMDRPGAAYLGARTMSLAHNRYDTPSPNAVTRNNVSNTTPVPTPDIPTPDIQPNPVEGGAQEWKRADWQFTPWQKISQGYQASKYAGLNRYMPTRSRYTPSYVDPALVNPEQTVGDMRTAANTQINSLNTLNPILRNAQAAGAYGQYLNQIPGVRSQYDNQNAGIQNQYRAMNNQTRNQGSQINMQNDQNYYRESVVGRQNFDNMKGFLGDQYMNNVLGDVQTNQTLAYNLLTQNNPAYGFDFRSGDFYRNKKSILDGHGNGADGELKSIMNIIDQISDPKEKAAALTKLYGVKLFGPSFNKQQKKGGRVNPYK